MVVRVVSIVVYLVGGYAAAVLVVRGLVQGWAGLFTIPLAIVVWWCTGGVGRLLGLPAREVFRALGRFLLPEQRVKR